MNLSDVAWALDALKLWYMEEDGLTSKKAKDFYRHRAMANKASGLVWHDRILNIDSYQARQNRKLVHTQK